MGAFKLRTTLLPAFVFLLLGTFAAAASPADTKRCLELLTYPQTPLRHHPETFFGNTIDDPYHWLESHASPEVRRWVKSQNELTAEALNGREPLAAVEARMLELLSRPDKTEHFRVGENYFHTEKDGSPRGQFVLYVSDSAQARGRVLVDPADVAGGADGTVTLNESFTVSPDGKHVIYGISKAGSDWVEWHVRNVRTGRDLPDAIHWSKFTHPLFDRSGEGFYYSRYPKPEAKFDDPNLGSKLYYHRLGTRSSSDELVYWDPAHPERGYSAQLIGDQSEILLINAGHDAAGKTAVFYKDLSQPDSRVVKVIAEPDASYELVSWQGSTVWLLTNQNASRGRLVQLDLKTPARNLWREVIAEDRTATLVEVATINGRFVATYVKNAAHELRVFDGSGKLEQKIRLPMAGTVSHVRGGANAHELVFTFESFTHPKWRYRFDLNTGELQPFGRQPAPKFDGAAFETRKVSVESKDGTEVPMFLVSRKGLKRTGANPIYLYGYGGFNTSLTPTYRASFIAWLELGGTIAVPCLRGGGEFGEDWHQSGSGLLKQNTFDDFIAAAEWLIREKYTSPEKLAIGGASNGGLLVGAALTQRPDLFAAAIPAVGVHDMLHYHKFTAGTGWTSEYGTSEDPAEFENLLSYSPLHQVKPGTQYPATLVMTGDHDDRVVPYHSYKFAAALQAAQSADKPVLLLTTHRAGHGAGKPAALSAREVASMWTFLYQALQMGDAARFAR